MHRNRGNMPSDLLFASLVSYHEVPREYLQQWLLQQWPKGKHEIWTYNNSSFSY